MKVTRRQFLRVSLGAIGAALVTEAVCFGADTSGVQKNAEKVPIRTLPVSSSLQTA